MSLNKCNKCGLTSWKTKKDYELLQKLDLSECRCDVIMTV